MYDSEAFKDSSDLSGMSATISPINGPSLKLVKNPTTEIEEEDSSGDSKGSNEESSEQSSSFETSTSRQFNLNDMDESEKKVYFKECY